MGIVITASKSEGKKDGPGFFGRIWGGFMDAVNWLDKKLGPGTDIHEKHDKNESKTGGGIMWTGKTGTYGEGRIGLGDDKAENYDEVGFWFSGGGSGGLGNWSDNFEALMNFRSSFDLIVDINDRFKDGNSGFESMFKSKEPSTGGSIDTFIRYQDDAGRFGSRIILKTDTGQYRSSGYEDYLQKK